MSALSNLADKPVSLMGSGRTDAGVHATGQVACADMPSSWTPESLRRSLNAILPPEIWIQSSSIAHPDFHPRYDAIARTYQYKVGIEPKARSPFYARTCWTLEGQLDYELLEFGANKLLGEHSFEAFAKSGQPERGYLCIISQAHWSHSDLGFCFEITANRYLHHMVRYLVGTMVDIARVNGQRMISKDFSLLSQTLLHHHPHHRRVCSWCTCSTPNTLNFPKSLLQPPQRA